MVNLKFPKLGNLVCIIYPIPIQQNRERVSFSSATFKTDATPWKPFGSFNYFHDITLNSFSSIPDSVPIILTYF